MTNRHLQSDFDLRCCQPFISLFRMNVFGWKITFQWQTTRKGKKTSTHLLICGMEDLYSFDFLTFRSHRSRCDGDKAFRDEFDLKFCVENHVYLCNIDLNGIFISFSVFLPLPIFILYFSSYLWHAECLFWRRQYDNTSTWHGNNRQQKIAIRGKKSNTKLT